jgi:hypothetical protein
MINYWQDGKLRNLRCPDPMCLSTAVDLDPDNTLRARCRNCGCHPRIDELLTERRYEWLHQNDAVYSET